MERAIGPAATGHKSIFTGSRRRLALVVLGPAALLFTPGCAYHRLVVPVPNAADQYYHPVDSSAVGWGAVEQRSVADKCTANSMSEVRVRTSLAHALATVFTLGLWQPARIEYRCGKPPTGEGQIDP